MRKTLSILLSILIFWSYSCKKEDESEPSVNQLCSEPKDIKGTFKVIKRFKYYDPSLPGGDLEPSNIAVLRQDAIASFYCPYRKTGENAGTIMCNGRETLINGYNSYAWQDTFNIYPEFDNIIWQVSGNGLIPASIDTINRGFPYIAGVSEDTIFRNEEYTVTIDTLLNCDSIMFKINPNYGTTIFGSSYLSGNTKTYTFNKAFWTDNPALGGYVELNIYSSNYVHSERSGINYEYLNNTIIHKVVWLEKL